MLMKSLEPDFKFCDCRGSLVQLVHDGWRQVNVIQSDAGKIRGGHYHKQNREAFYIISGKVKLELSSGTITESHIVKTGDMFTVCSYVTHTFYFIENTVLVSMYDLGVERPGQDMDIYTKEIN